MPSKKRFSLLIILLTALSIVNALPALAIGDFTINLSHNMVTASPGSSFQILVQVGKLPGGPPDPPVTLSVIPSPDTIHFLFNFNPNVIPPTFVSTLTVQVKPGTPAGTYQLQVNGISPAPQSHSKILTVIVSASDFSLGISPSTVTVKQGDIAQYTLSITYTNPADMGKPININLQNPPPATTFSVTPPNRLSIKTTSSTPLGTYMFTIIGTAFGRTHSASATLIVEEKPPPFDISVNVSPSTLTINIGEKKDCQVTVNLVSGSTETVSLSLSGSPSDVPHTISPTSANPTFTATVTFDASTASSTGTYTITFTASGGGVTKDATLTLIIKEEKDIAVTASPSTVTVKQNEKAIITIEVEETGGFEHSVTLTDYGLPSGTTSSFSPASNKPQFSSTYIIQTSDSTPEGSYPITIEGSGGGKTASTTITLNVEKQPTEQTTTEETSPQTTQPETTPNLERLLGDNSLIIITLLLIVIIILAALAIRRR